MLVFHVNAVHHLNAINVRQSQVAQHHIKVTALKSVYARLTQLRRHDFKVKVFNGFGDGPAAVGIVLDHENSGFSGHG